MEDSISAHTHTFPPSHNLESPIHLPAHFWQTERNSDETLATTGNAYKTPYREQPDLRIESETLVCVKYYNTIHHLTKYQHVLWVLRNKKIPVCKISDFQRDRGLCYTAKRDKSTHKFSSQISSICEYSREI